MRATTLIVLVALSGVAALFASARDESALPVGGTVGVASGSAGATPATDECDQLESVDCGDARARDASPRRVDVIGEHQHLDPAIAILETALRDVEKPATRMRLLSQIDSVEDIVKRCNRGAKPGEELTEREVAVLRALTTPVDGQIVEARLEQMKIRNSQVIELVTTGRYDVHESSDQTFFLSEMRRLGLDQTVRHPSEFKGELVSLPGADHSERRIVHVDDHSAPESMFAMRKVIELELRRDELVAQFLASIR